jgi:hypothetical protein
MCFRFCSVWYNRHQGDAPCIPLVIDGVLLPKIALDGYGAGAQKRKTQSLAINCKAESFLSVAPTAVHASARLNETRTTPYIYSCLQR